MIADLPVERQTQKHPQFGHCAIAGVALPAPDLAPDLAPERWAAAPT
jgi:hypothetical protein